MGRNGNWLHGNGREWECKKPFPHISTTEPNAVPCQVHQHLVTVQRHRRTRRTSAATSHESVRLPNENDKSTMRPFAKLIWSLVLYTVSYTAISCKLELTLQTSSLSPSPFIFPLHPPLTPFPPHFLPSTHIHSIVPFPWIQLKISVYNAHINEMSSLKLGLYRIFDSNSNRTE